MDMFTEGLKGVANIADNIGIAGTDKKDHDVNLIAFMDRAQASGLSFNSTKCVISQPEISFFGNRYTKDGWRPDPNKINDIRNMPSPKNKEDFQKIIGLMTYLSSFIPNFSKKCEPLRSLLKRTHFLSGRQTMNIILTHSKMNLQIKVFLHSMTLQSH